MPQDSPPQVQRIQSSTSSQEQDSLGISLTPTTMNDFPSQSGTNEINRQSTQGTITGVRVYSNRAEITRRFQCSVTKGENQLTILGLPKVLDRESVRAHRTGQGSCDRITIHGVTTSRIAPSSKTNNKSDDSELKKLEVEKKNVEKACERAKKTLPPPETYFSKIVPLANAITFPEAMESYQKFAEKVDNDISRLEDERAGIDEKIAKKKKELAGSLIDPNLNLKATIGICSDLEGEIKIELVYVVHNASWSAEYEILVDTQKTVKEEVTLIYRGSITQSTGEDWNNVIVTLVTAPSTLRLAVPALTPLIVPIHRQPQRKSTAMSSTSTSSKAIRVKSLLPPNQSKARVSHSEQPTAHQHLPGEPYEYKQRISILSGGIPQNVTIEKGKKFKAKMSYVCVPRKDTKVYWNARISNESSYALLNGQACVYMDNEFILKSDVPFVSPGRNFDCSLGDDPTIQVTYPPFYKEISSSGFFTKTIIYQFSQRIKIVRKPWQSTNNSKRIANSEDPKAINPGEINESEKASEDITEIIEKKPQAITIKIIDQAPISQDDFTVEMVDPKLGMSGKGLCGGKIADTRGYRRTSRGKESESKAFTTEPRQFKTVRTPFKTVRIPSKTASNVIAQWHGTDDGVEVEALGKDGKLNWVCRDVEAGQSIDLVLRWKATLPANVNIEID